MKLERCISIMYKHRIFILFVMVANISGYIYKGYEKLTTAKRLPVLMPKPTKIMEESEEVADDISVQSLYASKVSGRRMGAADIWNWEHWCELQPKIGNCSDKIERYYYDAQIDQCKNFTYSGCEGNNNSFDSSRTCERFCSGAPYESLKEEITNFCEIQKDVGICLELTTKYYYDVNEGQCKQFQYGGCGGNRNRFDTQRSCIKECGGKFTDNT